VGGVDVANAGIHRCADERNTVGVIGETIGP
jgi:hypothetical protein